MKGTIGVTLLLIVGFLTGCDSNSASENPPANRVETENIKELVQHYSSNPLKDVSASITSTELIIKDEEGKESTYDLRNEDFFVSIAPYENETHP